MRVGLDIGGTKTDAVVIDAEGRIVHRVRQTTGMGPEAVVATALDAIGRLADLAGMPRDGFESVGIGIPGMVANGTGRVAHAVNLDVDDLDLGGILAERVGVVVRVENDVKAAALGASHLLGATGSLAYLNLGTGLAAGVVVGGRLWRGSAGIAGEIGHISVDPEGARCACGQRGCVETLASGGALAREWGGSHEYPVLELFDAADRGDERAIALRTRLGHGTAAALRILALTVDVDQVVIGGGLSGLGERLHTVIRDALVEAAADSPFLASLHLEDRVELVPPGSPVAAIGAALVGIGELSYG
ncbi:ROK family protein [Plantibacter sp. Mn2098]|uniref:ROK family protein n=1 Tax=Plantibacter sp. Mn2098 TaxID=3395266 RepID=UPI003BDD0E7B